MDMYSKSGKNKIPQIILLVVQIIFIVISFLVLFIFNSKYQAFTFTLYSIVIYTVFIFNIITFFRFIFTLFLFIKRKIPNEEIISVTFAFALYYIGFPVITLFSNSYTYILFISGIILFLAGSFINSISELQRHLWKKKSENKGHIYTKGLFSISRHPNYFGDCLWVTGYAVISANPWSLIVPLLLFFFFYFLNIPVQEKHLKEKYKDDFESYKKRVKKFIPFIL